MATLTGTKAFIRGNLVTTGNVMNAMLVFVPLTIVGEHFGASPPMVFACAALSCITLSYRLGQATEPLGSRLGPISGGGCSTPPSATPPR